MNPTYIQLANGSTQCTVFFEEHPIKVLEQGPDLRFCLADVCKACALSNPSKALQQIRSEFEGANFQLAPFQTSGGIQNMTVIEEIHLYYLMMRGRSDTARRFRQWVYSDLLPTLRKSGHYELYDVRALYGIQARAKGTLPEFANLGPSDAELPEVPTCDKNGNYPVSYIQVMGELGDHYGMTQQGRDLLAWCIDRAKAQGYAIAKHQCGGTQVNWGLSEEDVRKRVEASTTCLKAQLAKAQEYIEELEAAPENKKAQADTQELRTKLELACGLVKSILENPNSKAIAGLAQTLVSELDKAV